jgi:hypothetical protein
MCTRQPNLAEFRSTYDYGHSALMLRNIREA